MNYIIGLSFVGGPDYLKRALDSIGEKHWEETYVVNSSEPLVLQSFDHRWSELVPVVPLSHTQSVNYIFKLGAGCDVLFMVHCDAECEPDTIDRLLAMLPTLPEKWAAVFTRYDCVAMYNPAAFAAIGPWDWQTWPSFYSENDWYYRLRLAGWSLHESGLPVKHVGSHVINHVDKWRKYRTALSMDYWRDMYIRKWNGDPGKETFTIPFNLPRGPYPDE